MDCAVFVSLIPRQAGDGDLAVFLIVLDFVLSNKIYIRYCFPGSCMQRKIIFQQFLDLIQCRLFAAVVQVEREGEVCGLGVFPLAIFRVIIAIARHLFRLFERPFDNVGIHGFPCILVFIQTMYLFGQVDGEAGAIRQRCNVRPVGIAIVICIRKAQLYQRGFVQYSFLSCTVRMCNSIFDRRVELAFFPAVSGMRIAAIDPSDCLGFSFCLAPFVFLFRLRCGQGDAGAFRSFPLPKAERNVTAVSRIGAEQGAVIN